MAVGDIDGDGFAEIIAGIGSNNLQPAIEIYSGADYSLMGRINPFADKATSINLAAGDINSDNFVDIIVGQGQGDGGTGRVEAFSGRLIFDVIQNSAGADNGDASVQDVNPLDGNALSKATELFTDVFRPFADEEYTGAVDVSSGYILPRPKDQQTNDQLDQVVQTSFANLIALKVNSNSSKDLPSIKTFYYTGEVAMLPIQTMENTTNRQSLPRRQRLKPQLPALAVRVPIKWVIRGWCVTT